MGEKKIKFLALLSDLKDNNIILGKAKNARSKRKISSKVEELKKHKKMDLKRNAKGYGIDYDRLEAMKSGKATKARKVYARYIEEYENRLNSVGGIYQIAQQDTNAELVNLQSQRKANKIEFLKIKHRRKKKIYDTVELASADPAIKKAYVGMLSKRQEIKAARDVEDYAKAEVLEDECKVLEDKAAVIAGISEEELRIANELMAEREKEIAELEASMQAMEEENARLEEEAKIALEEVGKSNLPEQRKSKSIFANLFGFTYIVSTFTGGKNLEESLENGVCADLKNYDENAYKDLEAKVILDHKLNKDKYIRKDNQYIKNFEEFFFKVKTYNLDTKENSNKEQSKDFKDTLLIPKEKTESNLKKEDFSFAELLASASLFGEFIDTSARINTGANDQEIREEDLEREIE
ncbi:MAG: hypothetical protein RR702_06740 [Clostridia bacterium]